MKKSPAKLDQSEWDFRQIDDMALPDATTYEYARTSDKLRPAICAWLETDIEGRPARDRMNDWNQLCRKHGGRPPITDAGIAKLHRMKAEAFKFGYSEIENLAVAHVIELRPDFPAPWMAFPIRYEKNPNASRIAVNPLAVEYEEIIERARSGENVMDMLESMRAAYQSPTAHFVLDINWVGHDGRGVTVESVIADFSKWVREEAKNHKLKRGKSSQAQTELLKCLAAYRLSKAGYTYPAAYELLRSKSDGGRLVPIYEDASGWSDAISKARKELSRIESAQW